jgi:hypothetical protein
MITPHRPSLRARAALALAGAALVAAGCDVVLGFSDKELRVAAEDASVPAIVDAATDAPPGTPDAGEPASCSALGTPPRPAIADDAANDRTVVLAFRRIDLGDRIDGSPNEIIGLNLDRTCTCPGPSSCKPYPDAGAHCDQRGSIDNEGTALFRFYSTLHGSLIDAVVNEQIETGLFSVILRISGYNGEANDPKVTFGFFTSVGTPRADGGPIAPRFDGHDTWDVDPSSAQAPSDGGLVPKYEVTDAYVADHALVGSLGDWPIPFGSATGVGIGLAFNMQLTGAHVTATLRADGAGNFRIDDGVLAGRWPTRNILGAIGALPNPFSGAARLCDDKTAYFNLTKLVCGAADVTADPTSTDRDAPCSAVSAGMRFEALPASIGASGTSPEAGVPCAPYECL